MRIYIIAAILLVAATVHAELPSATSSDIQKAFSSGKPTVIDLGARTCIPCKKMAPILEGMAAEYQGKASVFFIDVHENQSLAHRFKVQMIPTQIFFDAKGNEISRHMGFMEKAEIVHGLKAAGLK